MVVVSADLLRRAAETLRKHAGRASKAPWDVADDGLVWPDCMGDPVSGSAELENAEYIALMHPPVPLAIAALLDVQARLAACGYTVSDEMVEVARAILREDGP